VARAAFARRRPSWLLANSTGKTKSSIAGKTSLPVVTLFQLSFFLPSSLVPDVQTLIHSHAYTHPGLQVLRGGSPFESSFRRTIDTTTRKYTRFGSWADVRACSSSSFFFGFALVLLGFEVVRETTLRSTLLHAPEKPWTPVWRHGKRGREPQKQLPPQYSFGVS